MSIVTNAEPFKVNGYPVKGLIVIASCNALQQSFLFIISKMVFEQQQTQLLSATTDQLVELFVNKQPEMVADINANNKGWVWLNCT